MCAINMILCEGSPEARRLLKIRKLIKGIRDQVEMMFQDPKMQAGRLSRIEELLPWNMAAEVS